MRMKADWLIINFTREQKVMVSLTPKHLIKINLLDNYEEKHETRNRKYRTRMEVSWLIIN